MNRLDGKVALISGGARGQGSDEAKLFAQEGAAVVIGDILDEEGHKLEAEINESGGSVMYVHLDVTNELNWRSAVDAAVANYGSLDILVNNAGIIKRKGLEETHVSEWEAVHNVNSKGVFLGSKASIPSMKNSGGGSIVNISSIAGLTGSRNTAYGASKGAVRLLTKSTAVEYGPVGIRCNSVHPGIIATDMTSDMISSEDGSLYWLRRTPLGIIATSRDVSFGVLYLASDESRYVTGSELVIDGGITAQ